MTKFPLQYPCQILFQSKKELEIILLILDRYSIYWASMERPANYKPNLKKGALRIDVYFEMYFKNIEYENIPIRYTLNDLIKL